MHINSLLTLGLSILKKPASNVLSFSAGVLTGVFCRTGILEVLLLFVADVSSEVAVTGVASIMSLLFCFFIFIFAAANNFHDFTFHVVIRE